MSPNNAYRERQHPSFLRVSGDEPDALRITPAELKFSPRERG